MSEKAKAWTATRRAGKKTEAATTESRGGHRGLGRTRTRTIGRFRSHYTDARLYEVVRKAALHARPSYPKELRQTEFDRSRAEIGHAEAPSARQIATRLKRPWPQIVSDAVDEKATQAQLDSLADRTKEADWVTADHIFYAVRRVARLREQESVTRDQYAATRLQLIADDRKRHRFGGVLEENLPTGNQLETAARTLTDPDFECSDWERVLIVGDLAKPARRKKESLAMAEAIHLYIEATGGLLPRSERELDRFRRVAGIAVQKRPQGTSFDDHRREAVKYRETRGLVTTGEVAASGVEPAFDLSKLDSQELPKTIRRLGKSEKIEIIAAYLHHCDATGAKPRIKPYMALAADRGWPAASRLGEGMTWGQWVKAADEWRHEQAKKAA